MTGSSATLRRTAGVAVAVALVVLIGWLASRGTAGGDAAPGDAATPAETRSAPPSPATAPDATAPAEPTPEVPLATLPDGEHFGFVSAFDGETLTVDPAEFLSDEEAVSAAREDGEIGPGEDLPNPFYLRNPDAEQIRLAVAPGFEVTLVDHRGTRPGTVDATTLAALFAGDADASWVYGWFDGPVQQMPMVLEVAGGEVVRADQRYLP